MIDCATYAPLPDYYAGILWSKLMGTVVLKAASSDPTLRAYAHCSAGVKGSVTVLLINLDPAVQRTVTLDGLLSTTTADDVDVDGGGGLVTTMTTMEWHLTGPNGMNATAIALNGKLLVAKVVAGGTEYDLPPLEGQRQQHQQAKAGVKAASAPVVELAPASVAFVQLAAPTGVCS
jgi:hypothetical protein